MVNNYLIHQDSEYNEYWLFFISECFKAIPDSFSSYPMTSSIELIMEKYLQLTYEYVKRQPKKPKIHREGSKRQ